MTKHYCDICGQEIDTNVYYSIKYEKVIRVRSIGFAVKANPFDSRCQNIIACERCWNNITHKEKGEKND